jgi:hypothetical protein
LLRYFRRFDRKGILAISLFCQIYGNT